MVSAAMVEGALERRRAPALGILGHLVRLVLCAALALVALAAYEHFRLAGAREAAWASLGVGGLCALSPLRAVVRSVFAVEGAVLHAAHGLGGLGLIALAGGGVVSGGPVLDHAATAPFAVMGAAQALLHGEHPRTPEQAAALRRFVSGLPQLREVVAPGALGTPAGARRAAAVLGDLLGRAQALGETELRSDPGFGAAVRRASMRAGLSFGLDAIDRAVERLAQRPEATSAVPALRARLAAARRTVAAGGPPPANAPR